MVYVFYIPVLTKIKRGKFKDSRVINTYTHTMVNWNMSREQWGRSKWVGEGIYMVKGVLQGNKLSLRAMARWEGKVEILQLNQGPC